MPDFDPCGGLHHGIIGVLDLVLENRPAADPLLACAGARLAWSAPDFSRAAGSGPAPAGEAFRAW
jgi:hypothetical protein